MWRSCWPTEVVQDLKDLEEFGLALPEKRLHKVKGTDLWELRTLWQQPHRPVAVLRGGGTTPRRHDDLPEEGAGDSLRREESGAGAHGPMAKGAGPLKLSEFIDSHVRTGPEWAEAYDESELRRQSARMLARARREQGISQAQLAERCGTDQAVISRIERGVVSPSLDTLWRVSAGLGLRPVLRLEAMPEPAATERRIPQKVMAQVKEAEPVAAKASQSERSTATARVVRGKATGRRAAKTPAGATVEVTPGETRAGRRQRGRSVGGSTARQDPS